MATKIARELTGCSDIDLDVSTLVGRSRDIQKQYDRVRLALLGEMGQYHRK